MWKVERTIRLAEEELTTLEEERRELERGKFTESLLSTPRDRLERHVFWSALERKERRRRARGDTYASLDKKQETLQERRAKAKRSFAKKSQLPPLHMQLLRRPGEASEEVLQEIQKNPNVKGVYGYSALHVAVSQGKKNIVQLVLQNPSCDVNAIDAAGYTALHHALSDPAKHDIARVLVDSGADLTIRNREGLNPAQVALSLGYYNAVTRFLSSFSTWELACMFARRFFEEYFKGNPEYHHYKRLEYEHNLLVAYVVVMHPRAIRWELSKNITRRRLLGREITMNQTERFFHTLGDKYLYSSGYDGRLGEKALQRKQKGDSRRAIRSGFIKRIYSRVTKWTRDDLDNEDEDGIGKASDLKVNNGQAIGLAQGEEEEDVEDIQSVLGLFKEFPLQRVKRWRTKALAWRFDSGAKFCKRIADIAFQGKLTPEQVAAEMENGRKLFAAWREKNKKRLLDDEARRMLEVADAVRLRRMREERERRRLEEEARKEEIRRERAKRGLDKVNPDACVVISDDTLYYGVDEADAMIYSINLGSRPTGVVLIRFAVDTWSKENSDNEIQFQVSPSLMSFTPTNWNEPQYAEVRVADDDAIVRLKRGLAQHGKGHGDHKVIHSIQSTTDWSYKHPELEWKPSNTIRIRVVD